jgi:ABC-type lipoprotein export system ATPase subunit
MNKIISASSVSKWFKTDGRKAPVLEEISLDIVEGEFLSIVGPSGAGKSTLLHILGGLDAPSKGKVFFQESDVYRLNDKRISSLRNQHIGFVFQFYHLIEELTVLENAALPALLVRKERKTSFTRAQKLLEYLGILDKKRSLPHQLSGGEKQKTAIARALINEPQVILCDEPTGNLDSDSAQSVLELLKRLNKENGKTIVMVTHNSELSRKADRVIKLKDGRIVER